MSIFVFSDSHGITEGIIKVLKEQILWVSYTFRGFCKRYEYGKNEIWEFKIWGNKGK